MKKLRSFVCVAASVSLFVLAPALCAEEPADPTITQKNPDGTGAVVVEKPKIPPLKVSAWCAFKDYSDGPPPKPDPASEQSRQGYSMRQGYGRRGKWTHVLVEIKNTTEDTTYKGTATCTLNPARRNDFDDFPYRMSSKQEIEVGPKSEKQYHFSVFCHNDGWDREGVHVQVNTKDGIKERVIHIEDIDETRKDLIVVVSENAGAFKFLSTRQPRGADISQDMSKFRGREVATVDPSELPSRWHDLCTANLIIIEGPPRERLTDEQWSALRTYVQSGGNLLITAGKDPSRLKGPIEDLVGISVKDVKEIAEIDSISPPYKPARDDWRLPVLDVSVVRRPAEVSYNKSTKIVERCKRSLGAGTLTFLSFSPNDKLLENWEGRKNIPNSILRVTDKMFGAEVKDDEDLSPQQPWLRMKAPATSVSGLRSTLDQSFAEDTPVQMQSRNTVLWFFLFYLLCAAPVNYFIFGWFKRREIGWLAVPLWSAGFAIFAYVYGFMGQTGLLTINEVSVIELGSGEKSGTCRTFLGMYAPRRDDYRMEFPGIHLSAENLLDTQAAPSLLMNRSAQNITIPEIALSDTDAGLVIEKMRVETRSTRRLEIIHRTMAGDGIVLSFNDKTNELSVANNTGRDIYYPVFVYDGHAFPCGTIVTNDMLRVGETFKKVLPPRNSWKEAREFFYERNFTFRTVRGQHTAARARAVADYLRERHQNFGEGVFCGWLEGGGLPVKVGPSGQPAVELEKNHFEGFTLVLVPTPKADVLDEIVPEPLSMSYSNSLPAATQPRWTQLGGTNQIKTTVNGVNCHFMFKIKLPDENITRLATQGYRVQFSAKVGTSTQIDATDPGFNLQIQAEVRNNSTTGQQWIPVTDRDTGIIVTSVSPNRPQPFSIDIPLDVRGVRSSSENTIILNVHFEDPSRKHGKSFDLRNLEAILYR